jgi:alkylation response protein AidB-like acyl-CoA dehydrogenase
MACPEPRGARRSDAEGESLALLLPQVSRFLRTEVDGYAIDRDGAIPDAVRSGLARLGLFGLTIPNEYGGAGLSLGAACRVVAEIARVDRSLAVMVGLHAGLGTRGIVELGSPSLRAHWLPRLADGNCVASFGATESGAGSALASVRTVGRLGDGDIVIDGEKSYVTNGGSPPSSRSSYGRRVSAGIGPIRSSACPPMPPAFHAVSRKTSSGSAALRP